MRAENIVLAVAFHFILYCCCFHATVSPFTSLLLHSHILLSIVHFSLLSCLFVDVASAAVAFFVRFHVYIVLYSVCVVCMCIAIVVVFFFAPLLAPFCLPSSIGFSYASHVCMFYMCVYLRHHMSPCMYGHAYLLTIVFTCVLIRLLLLVAAFTSLYSIIRVCAFTLRLAEAVVQLRMCTMDPTLRPESQPIVYVSIALFVFSLTCAVCQNPAISNASLFIECLY